MPPSYQNRAARIAGVVFTGVWLFYLIGMVSYLFTHHYSAPYIAAGLTIIVVFSALYLILVPNWPAPRRYTLPGLAVLALLATAACVIYGGTGAVALWIFMGSASGLLVPDRRWAARAVVGCIACYVIFSATGHVSGTDFLSNLLPVVFIGFAMIGLRRQFQLTAELTQAREEVAQLAASEERLRLARDMHDLTGQSLSMITLKSELAARLLGRLPESADRDRIRDEIEQVAGVSRQTLRDIREAISGYRGPTTGRRDHHRPRRPRPAPASTASRSRRGPHDAFRDVRTPDAEAPLAWWRLLLEGGHERRPPLGREELLLTSGLTRRGQAPMSLTGSRRRQGPHPVGRLRPPAVPGERRAAHLRVAGHVSERLKARVGGTLRSPPDLAPRGFCLIATVPATAPQPAPPPPSGVTSSRA